MASELTVFLHRNGLQVGEHAGEFLKLRIFNGELMTPSAYATRAVQTASGGWSFPQTGLAARAKSAVSLALLEDLGWYFPVYSAAEPLPWGRGLGADFALSPCNNWPTTESTYTCRTTGGRGTPFDATQLGRLGCNAARTHVGVCHFVNHPSPLPRAYRYFSSPVDAVNYGGPSEQADYCPLITPDPSGLTPTPEGAAAGSRDCRVPRASAVLGIDNYQDPGPGSACFSGRRSNLQAISGCYKHFCKGGVLSVAVGHQLLDCPRAGGDVIFQLFGITIFCPPASELCPQFPTAVPPSIRANAVTCSPSKGDCRCGRLPLDMLRG